MRRSFVFLCVLTGGLLRAGGQTAQGPVVPDWALPSSPTHKQVAPPAGFHRPTRMFPGKIGVFDGQADVGGPLVPGGASFDVATGAYTVRSAGYNIWYNRDEFRFLWKKMSGDVSLAADISFPEAGGFDDRKAVLVIRQSLDDDAAEVVAAQHGGGLFHIAERAQTDAQMGALNVRIADAGLPESAGFAPGNVSVRRLGLEKKGDDYTLWVSLAGEPMHPLGPPLHLHLDGPFYVGIGFCSHLPATVDTAVMRDVRLENAAEQVR